jgi:glucokinase
MNLTIQRAVIGFDAGGTRIRGRVVDANTGTLISEETYPTNRFGSFDELIDHVMATAGTYTAVAIFAVLAGIRQEDGNIEMTNVQSWPVFNPAATSRRLGIPVGTGNDMLGAGAGLASVVARFIKMLRRGLRKPGPRLIVTISSGIGICLVLPDGTTIVLSEGGHTTWQPMNEAEEKYLAFLRNKYNIVTVTGERAASGGQGFSNLYDFLVSLGRKPSDKLAAQVKAYRAATPKPKPIGPLITRGALDGDPFCEEAMQILGSILGQLLRNYVLMFLATGGLFLIGGVSKIEILQYLVRKTSFLETLFATDAQHSDVMVDLPIDVITDDGIGVRGAAALALEMVNN